MNRIFFSFLVVLLGFAPVAEAQSNQQAKKQSLAKQKATPASKINQRKAGPDDTVTLRSVGTHQAYDSAAAFTIADPVINTLKLQAAGFTPLISSSGIVGMPKRAYGFSNGKILLRPTTSLSSGTLYGSGAVGTGTSIMGVGAGERAVGVNGKNPTFGTWLWGSKSPTRNLPPSYRDSSERR